MSDYVGNRMKVNKGQGANDMKNMQIEVDAWGRIRNNSTRKLISRSLLHMLKLTR
jgi:hypothetical protein